MYTVKILRQDTKKVVLQYPADTLDTAKQIEQSITFGAEKTGYETHIEQTISSFGQEIEQYFTRKNKELEKNVNRISDIKIKAANFMYECSTPAYHEDEMQEELTLFVKDANRPRYEIDYHFNCSANIVDYLDKLAQVLKSVLELPLGKIIEETEEELIVPRLSLEFTAAGKDHTPLFYLKLKSVDIFDEQANN